MTVVESIRYSKNEYVKGELSVTILAHILHRYFL